MSFVGHHPCFMFFNFTEFVEQLEQYFEFNEVAENQKRPILLLAIDVYTHKTLRDLCHPQQPKDKTYDELILLLSSFLVIRKCVFRERIKFYEERQMQNESIANWFARIKKLRGDCKFGENADVILLDRFVTGICDTAILDRLCEEDESLTIEKALKIAIDKESCQPNRD